jgi:hypothetical protein
MLCYYFICDGLIAVSGRTLAISCITNIVIAEITYCQFFIFDRFIVNVCMIRRTNQMLLIHY